MMKQYRKLRVDKDYTNKNDFLELKKEYEFKSYNDYITRKLDEKGIIIPFRKRKFDYFCMISD